MKILQINATYNIGSTGRIVFDLKSELEKQGHSAFCAYGYGQTTDDKSYKIIKGNGNFTVKKNLAYTFFTGKHGCIHKNETIQLLKWIDKVNPDVIHMHNIHGNYLNLKLLFQHLKKIKKPIVWTLHDCWSFTGHCAYFDCCKCEKWKEGCYECKNLYSYPKSLFKDCSKKQWVEKKQLFTNIPNLVIITPSKWLANLVKKSYLSDYPIKVINNGIDLSLFRPTHSNFRKKNNIQEEKIILGVANSWKVNKGINYFIEFSKKLGKEYKIVLIGLSKKQIKNTPENIIKIERTTSTKELVELYSTADLLLNPTLEDNFPTVNLEAQACGTPVITFDTGGSPEAVTAETGLVVKQGDMEGLYKGICEISKNNVVEQQCRKRALQFSKDLKYKEYINIYSKLIENVDNSD